MNCFLMNYNMNYAFLSYVRIIVLNYYLFLLPIHGCRIDRPALCMYNGVCTLYFMPVAKRHNGNGAHLEFMS
jgi:hypothetical protein